MNNAPERAEEIETKSITVSSSSSAVVQAVYKEMLDTSESIAKSFEPGKKIDREDIKNYCQRFQQTCQQYQLKGFKSKFTIRRDEDHTEVFASLDRFMASDSKGGKKTAGISVEFQFLIKPPGFTKYQEYKAAISIDSTDYSERSGSESFILNMIGAPSFLFSIDYVDYSVARTFLSMAEDWHNQLDEL